MYVSRIQWHTYQIRTSRFDPYLPPASVVLYFRKETSPMPRRKVT